MRLTSSAVLTVVLALVLVVPAARAQPYWDVVVHGTNGAHRTVDGVTTARDRAARASGELLAGSAGVIVTKRQLPTASVLPRPVTSTPAPPSTAPNDGGLPLDPFAIGLAGAALLAFAGALAAMSRRSRRSRIAV
jgi:hypothetical protein